MDSVIGVILDGVGDDGKEGSLYVKRNRGKVIVEKVEDKKKDVLCYHNTSWGRMPTEVIKSGSADYILGPEEIRKTLEILLV